MRSIQQGTKLQKEQATPLRRPRPIWSVRVRRVNPVQCSPLPLRVPDPLGGRGPFLPCE